MISKKPAWNFSIEYTTPYERRLQDLRHINLVRSQLPPLRSNFDFRATEIPGNVSSKAAQRRSRAQSTSKSIHGDWNIRTDFDMKEHARRHVKIVEKSQKITKSVREKYLPKEYQSPIEIEALRMKMLREIKTVHKEEIEKIRKEKGKNEMLVKIKHLLIPLKEKTLREQKTPENPSGSNFEIQWSTARKRKPHRKFVDYPGGSFVY
eukprot:Sdes_comp20162_c0_seq3m13319